MTTNEKFNFSLIFWVYFFALVDYLIFDQCLKKISSSLYICDASPLQTKNCVKSVKCKVCMPMKLKNDSIEKLAWKCTRCGTSQSIRNVTFLKKCDKHLSIFFKLAYHTNQNNWKRVIYEPGDCNNMVSNVS